MRMIFSLIGLLIVVAVVGVLAKSQLSAVTQLPSQMPHSASSSASAAAPAHIVEQSKPLPMQVKDHIGAAMEAASDARLKAESADSK